MRKSIVVLGACLVLVLGMTGCDDDEDLFNVPDVPVPVEEVAAATQGVVTAVTTVTAVTNGFFQAISQGGGTGAAGFGGGGACLEELDVTDVVCTGGTASVCTDLPSPFADLFGCATLVGELENLPPCIDDPSVPCATHAVTLISLNEVLLSMTIDGETSVTGTLTLVSSPPLGGGGPICLTFIYDLMVTIDGTTSALTGTIEGCPDGSIFRNPIVVIPDLVRLEFVFSGFSATVQVLDATTLSPITFCTIDPLDATPDCSSSS